MPQQQYNSRSSVIPFQVPDIAKAAYEQSYGQRQTERAEKKQRTQKTQADYEQNAELVAAIPPDYKGRAAVQSVVDETLDAASAWEQSGSDEDYRIYIEKKAEAERAIKATTGFLSAYNSQYQDFLKNPSSYSTTKEEAEQNRNAIYNQELTSDQIGSQEYIENMIKLSPKKSMPVNEYTNPATVKDWDYMALSSDFVDVTSSRGATVVTMKPEAKQALEENILSKVKLDPKFAIGMALFYQQQANPELFQEGKGVTEEMIQQVAEKMQTDKNFVKAAVSAYADIVMSSLDAKAKDKYYRVDAPKTESADKPNALNEKQVAFKGIWEQQPTINSSGNNVRSALGSGKFIKTVTKEVDPGTLEKVDITTVHELDEIETNPKTGEVISITFTSKGKPPIVYDANKANAYLGSNFADWKEVVRRSQTQQQTTEKPKDEEKKKKNTGKKNGESFIDFQKRTNGTYTQWLNS